MASLNKTLTARTPAVATASSASASVALAAAGTVSAVTYTPDATITGAATNNRTLSLVNKGQNGSGNTTIATLTFANGTNATGFDETAITLSGTPANLVVADGDVLALVSTANGTGIADPGGLLKVTVARS